MDRTFRPLETHERELLERLLDPEFAGRDELRRQLDVVTACQILDDGTLALQCGPCLPAPVKRRVPTEGECRDADGGVIQVLLHVVNGVMHELEIFVSSQYCGEIMKVPRRSRVGDLSLVGE
jgi:hypothetical protein